LCRLSRRGRDAFTPGGADEAAYYRNHLLTSTPGKWKNIAGEIGSFITWGAGIKALLPAEMAAKVALSARTSTLGKSAQVAGENFLFDTKLYANHIMNYNKEATIEDWANQVGTGFIMASPFIFSFQARVAVSKGIGLAGKAMEKFRGTGAGGDLATALGGIRNVQVGYALMKGGKEAGRMHQKAAALGVGQRVIRWVQGMGRKGRVGPEVLDDPFRWADDVVETAAKDYEAIRGITPQNMWKAQTLDAVDDMKAVLRRATGEELPFLDDINPKQMKREINAVGTSLRSLQNPAKTINKKVKRPAALDMDVELINEATYNVKVEQLLSDLEEAGYSDVLGYLKNIEHLDKPNLAYDKLVKARVDSRFGKHAYTPGAEVADARIAEILQDPDLWPGVIAGRGEKINKGINKIADNFTTIDDFRRSNLADYPERITSKDVAKLNEVDAALEQVRQGYEQLRIQDVLGEETVRGLENTLKATQRQITKSKEGYMRASQINKARMGAQEAAEEVLIKARGSRLKLETELNQLHAISAVNTGAGLASLKEKVRSALGVTREVLENASSAQLPGIGVLALRTRVNPEEREFMYNVMEDALRTMASSPDTLSEQLSRMTSTIEEREPILSHMLQRRSADTIYYLASQLPPKAGSFRNPDFPPHQADIDKFLDKAMAAYEPLSVGLAAAFGMVTPGMTEAVKYTNPSMYSEMYAIFAETIAEMDEDQRARVPDAVVNGMEIFLGGLSVFHQGPSLIQLQSNYAQTAAEEQQIRGGQAPGSTMNNPGPQNAGSDYTFTQRITGF
jgi:hypothetical protein